jgi:streptogramin lyase
MKGLRIRLQERKVAERRELPVRSGGKILLASSALLVSGCASVPGNTPVQTTSGSMPGTTLQGRVHGGQQPISGAHLYVYAANTSGYGGQSISMLTSGTGRTSDGTNYYVTTQSDGSFSITSDYNCPSANSQVYLYSVGGNPGVGGGANLGAGLLAALGTCSSLSSTMFIVVNEVSTVAAAYAFAGFATDATHVSSSNSAQAETGIANAFAAASNLDNLATGIARATTPAGDGTAPQAEINTLGNILAACVNSTGPSSGPCSTLFANAKNGSLAPSDTATAAINIAHNPGANLDNLYGLHVAMAPFQPDLSAEPNDFAVSIIYTGGGLDGTGYQAPNGIAVDGYGNVWVANFQSSSITELSPTGSILSGTNGYSAAGLDEPTSLAIDIYGNVWAANYNGDSVSEFNSSGTKISGPPGFTGSGLNRPYGIAFDNLSHVWIANIGGNNLSEFTSSGIALSGVSGFPVGSLVGPAGIASDSSGNIWAANYLASTSSITESDPTGGQSADPSGFTGGGLNSPYAIAIDATGNVWVTNQGGNGSLSEFSSAGTALSGTNGYINGGLSDPKGLAVDGLGNIWVANFTSNNFSGAISEFNSSGSPITGSNGYVGNGVSQPYGIAIDLSGNVWVANDNGTSSVTEFIGAAAPVVTPLAAGVQYNELGKRP